MRASSSGARRGEHIQAGAPDDHPRIRLQTGRMVLHVKSVMVPAPVVVKAHGFHS